MGGGGDHLAFVLRRSLLQLITWFEWVEVEKPFGKKNKKIPPKCLLPLTNVVDNLPSKLIEKRETFEPEPELVFFNLSPSRA